MQHDRVWEQGESRRSFGFAPEWKPKGTYGILAAIAATFVLQLVVASTAPGWHNYIFAIHPQWFLQPWALVTSTLAHSVTSLSHILFNSLILFFFGPIAERLLGTKRFVWLFMLAGAISGIAQVTLEPGAALGASGALMMTFGTLVMVMPNEKLLIWFILPVPFWLAAVFYVALDLLGVLNPYDGIGNFAHLAGMALGLWLGWTLRQARRKPRMHVHWTAMR